MQSPVPALTRTQPLHPSGGIPCRLRGSSSCLHKGGSASPSPSLHVLGSDGLKPSFPASRFHPGCFCISPEEPLHSRFPVTPSHHPNVAMHSNSSPWEGSTPLPARTSPSLWPLSPSSPRDRWCLCWVLVPRLPAQEAALFGGTLNPLGFNLLFSTL